MPFKGEKLPYLVTARAAAGLLMSHGGRGDEAVSALESLLNEAFWSGVRAGLNRWAETRPADAHRVTRLLAELDELQGAEYDAREG